MPSPERRSASTGIEHGFLFPKRAFCTRSALYPACQMAPPVLGRNNPHPIHLIPSPWKSTSGRRGVLEQGDNGVEEERGSLRKGEREGVDAEAVSFGAVKAEAHQPSVACGLLCREPPAVVICCSTRHPWLFPLSPFSQQDIRLHESLPFTHPKGRDPPLKAVYVPSTSSHQLLGREEGDVVSWERVCPTEQGKRMGTFAGPVSAECR